MQTPTDTATEMPKSTRRYLAENELAFSLTREEDKAFTNCRKLRGNNIIDFLGERVKQATIGSLRYLRAVVHEFDAIQKLSLVRKTKNGKRALVLGNGPSLGYLSKEQLRRFQEEGGEVFSVNYWSSTHLHGAVPDYLVISDGGTLMDPNSKLGRKLSPDYQQKNALLNEFLYKFEKVKIICPLARVSELAEKFCPDRIMGFVDHEMRALTSNIDPRYPRGYLSMTLFKALAISIHMGYDDIFILGMDNSYPRDIFCDNKNTIFRIERHAGERDTIFDQSAYYPSMDVWAQDLFDLFFDLHRCFKGHPVINLDPYSLTDVFDKIAHLGLFESVLGIGENGPMGTVAKCDPS